jgi:hypothetical protein
MEVSAGTINNLYSEFGKALRNFLAFEEAGRNENVLSINLARSLSRRNLFDISNKVIEHDFTKINNNVIDPEQCLHLFLLDSIKIGNLENMKNIKIQTSFDTVNSSAMNLLSCFLRWYLELSNRTFLMGDINNIHCPDAAPIEFVNLLNEEEFIKFLDSSGCPDKTAIIIYYKLVNLLTNECTVKDYYKVKKMLIDNAGKFSKEDLYRVWSIMLDLLIIKLIPVDRKFYAEVFEINRFFYELKIFPGLFLDKQNNPDIKFPILFLRNVITVAVFCMEFEWAENFLEEYINYVSPQLRDDEYNNNKGILNFKNKKYEESLEYFSKVRFTDIYENLNTRFYILMNLIELKRYESALSAVQSIRQFHKKNKVIPEIIGELVSDSLKYFSEIIKAEEADTKIDPFIYKEASRPVRYYHKGYILNKMKKII